ncbi:restriction endonuclease [Rheinheimera sp.]|uniref:restriction endonuclease n=1 Tax=Rheinheimera sp. TaxID=1869214 RepID=UPI00307E966D
MSEKKLLLAALLRENIRNNVDFRAVLSSLAERKLGKSKLDAESFADANIRRYWNWITKEIDLQSSRGIVPFFTFADNGGYSFSSITYDLLSSSCQSNKKLGKLVSLRPSTLNQIDSLTEREYEALSCVVCSKIGSIKVKLTPPGNEGGIDFFATISVKNASHIFSAIGSEVRIVGQCKKYKAPVQVDRLDQFISTLQNVRHRSDRVRKHIPSWFSESRGPIVGWIIAHSGFQTGTADEAKNHGIILSDSLDLAEVLCTSIVGDVDNICPDTFAQAISDECRMFL